MNIDWTALNAGMKEVLEKSAAAPRINVRPTNIVPFPGAVVPRPKVNPTPRTKPVPNPAAPNTTTNNEPPKPMLPKVIKGTAVGGLGLGGAYLGGKAIDAGGDALEGLSGLLPGALGMLGSLGGKGGGGAAGQENGVLSKLLGAINAKPNLLNYDTGAPHSLGDAVAGAGLPNMGWGKTASITEAITKAVQTRAINDTMDKMLMGKQETAPAPQDKRLEITSKYPEMQTMLKDEQNKAYLERLLKE